MSIETDLMNELRLCADGFDMFRHDYELIRRTKTGSPKINDEGRFVQDETVTHIKFKGSAPQPINDRDMKWLPDGIEPSSTIRIYCNLNILEFNDQIRTNYAMTGQGVDQYNDYRIIAVSHRHSHTRIYATQLHRQVHD